jgi:Holliday junction resolvase RusA-like endonuclease
MKSFTLRVDTPPRSKGRPRVLPNQRAYTPKATVDAERVVKEAWQGAGYPKLDGPLSMSIEFDPKGYTITLAEAQHSSKMRADLDNLIKLVGDGLNKVAYNDDKQIVHLNCSKH